MFNKESLLHIKDWKKLTIELQIFLIVVLYTVTLFWYTYESSVRGSINDVYPLSAHLFFVPLYEEILFRGFLLEWALKRYSAYKAIIFVSILFGLWHLKNIIWHNPLEQMLYTGLVFSPIISYITLKTRNVWIAVILHYVHNLLIGMYNFYS